MHAYIANLLMVFLAWIYFVLFLSSALQRKNAIGASLFMLLSLMHSWLILDLLKLWSHYIHLISMNNLLK